jgi:hypothetical protein
MKLRPLFLALAAVLVGLTALVPAATTASAAPPGNDEVSGATVLGPAPSHVEQLTTEATTSPEEAQWNDSCGAPVLEHGVWFTATSTADVDITVDVTGSDFGAGILVLAGEPDSFAPISCGPGSVSVEVTAGQTLHLLVFGDGRTESTSGTLILDTYVTPPAPSISVTLDPRGTVDKEGVAHISGTVTCSSDDPAGLLYDVSGTLRQRVGRGFVEGSIYAELQTPCDGFVRAWTTEVVSDGMFRSGRADTTVVAGGCNTFSCGEGYSKAVIKLNRRGK